MINKAAYKKPKLKVYGDIKNITRGSDPPNMETGGLSSALPGG